MTTYSQIKQQIEALIILLLIMNLPIYSNSFDDSTHFLSHSETNSKPTGKSFKTLFIKSIDSIKIEYEYSSIGKFPIENSRIENYFRTKSIVNIPQDDKIFWKNLIDQGIADITIPDTSKFQFAIGCDLDLYFKISLYENKRLIILHFPSWGISEGCGRIMESGQLYFVVFTNTFKISLKDYFDKIVELTFPKDINSCGFEERKNYKENKTNRTKNN